MKILLIDNYDSFTYNLVHYASELGAEVQVVRNDVMGADRIVFEKPDGIIISPGPGAPKDAGICLDLIKKSAGKVPVFGVCLGHQAIGEAFGGKIVRTEPMHGKTSPIYHEGKGVFQNIPSPFTATRYHSLIIQELGLPDELEVTARTKDGIIMGIRHTEYNIEGVQFHPESIASEFGHKLLENFLKRL